MPNSGLPWASKPRSLGESGSFHSWSPWGTDKRLSPDYLESVACAFAHAYQGPLWLSAPIRTLSERFLHSVWMVSAWVPAAVAGLSEPLKQVVVCPNGSCGVVGRVVPQLMVQIAAGAAVETGLFCFTIS